MFVGMPTDGADFGRRRPLYGQFYVALKNGADIARLASLASDGVPRDIGQRPLVALKPAVTVVVSIANSNLFTKDTKRSLLVQEAEKLKARFADSSPSTRDIVECVLRAGLQAVDRGGALDQQKVTAGAIQKLIRAWCLDTIGDNEGQIRSLEPATLPHAEAMANALLKSYNGKLPSNWKRSKTNPISHTSEALNSEVLTPLNRPCN
jgi:hypothetical protein